MLPRYRVLFRFADLTDAVENEATCQEFCDNYEVFYNLYLINNLYLPLINCLSRVHSQCVLGIMHIMIPFIRAYILFVQEKSGQMVNTGFSFFVKNVFKKLLPESWLSLGSTGQDKAAIL